MALIQHGHRMGQKSFAAQMNASHLSISAHRRDTNSYQGKQYNGNAAHLGRRQVINSPFLGTAMSYSMPKIGSNATNGWTKIQSSLPIATALISNNLLMKRVPLHGFLSYHRMEKKSFIHRQLMGHTRFLKSTYTAAQRPS